MTREELRNRLEEHADTYIIFHGASTGIRDHFRQEDWYSNNRRHTITVIHLTNCLFQLVRIKIKNFNYIPEDSRNDILDRHLNEALQCNDLNKILTEMDN